MQEVFHEAVTELEKGNPLVVATVRAHERLHAAKAWREAPSAKRR